MVDFIVNICSKQAMQNWEHDLPKTFLMDCLTAASGEGTVPFAAGEENVAAWLEEKKASICNEYHIHDKDEDEKPVQKVISFLVVKAKAKATLNILGGPTHDDVGTSKPGSWHWNGKGQRIEDEEEEDCSAGEEPIAMNEKQQRRFDAEIAERMRVLYEPLPPRVRY